MGEESGFTVYEDFAPAVLPFFFSLPSFSFSRERSHIRASYIRVFM